MKQDIMTGNNRDADREGRTCAYSLYDTGIAHDPPEQSYKSNLRLFCPGGNLKGECAVRGGE